MQLSILAYSLYLLLSPTFSAAAPPIAQDRCRCLFGDACWPSADDLAELQKQVSQPLLQPLPPASPCYPVSHPSGNCDEIHQQWTNASWRADQAGAMQGENFETFVFSNGTTSACFMNTSLGVPCTQGSVPVIGVDARNDVDVQAAVNFAGSHNLRLVVKSTGHDLSGRSTARGSFIVWTHHMKNITFHDTFTPDGAPTSETHDHAITLGSGVQWQEAYEAVNAKDRVLVGGLSAGGTVGAASGWVLGGGHSVLSPSFGLGVDNALQFTMVSSNGTRYVANAYQNPDLFFALRGGGGGTYGIVTSVTYQTHPNLPLITAIISTSTNSSTPNAPLQTLFSELIHITPSLSDAGWSGFFSLAPDPSTGTLGLSAFYVMLNGTIDQANASIGPFFSSARSLAASGDGSLTVQTAIITPVDSFFTWYNTFFPQASSAGTNGALGSWLLPRDVIEANPDEVAQTLLPLTELTVSMVGGGAVSKVNPGAMGVNPAWRKALLHTIFATGWAEGTPVDIINQLVDGLKQNMTTLRALAPESGAYFNEASLFEPDPQRTFFGDNRFKLKTIKQDFDPIDLFVVAEGIGSDDWDADLVCRL
ncbi:FAD binding domain-containing protein [Trametes coccinea BRFM310]|uniref:FAD binding domain-containing protein n=1 Tax=Trametes coccinea (strain BRFM310) TaxID=1353009 RepID=A0A1Y2IRW0_TRAC3|nr:FAD binding domain-containing protein [Trametes coccinea BRFM310]